MAKKIKRCLQIIFPSLIIFIAHNAYALEVRLPGLGENPSLGQYVGYIFGFAIATAGIISVISFAVGAIGLISPDVSAHNEAKDRMKGAVLGLVLTIASFAIINTINPDLLKGTIISLPPIITPPQGISPGVYVYTKPGCQGGSNDVLGPLISNQNTFQAPFNNGGLKSFKIINDSSKGIYYGVILHKNPGLDNGGICTLPITAESCQTVSIKASAADIFMLNPLPEDSGNGADFFGKPFGNTTGAHGGSYFIYDGDIDSMYGLAIDLTKSDQMCLDYTGVNVEKPYKFKCTNSTCNFPTRGKNYTCTTNDTNNTECLAGETCTNLQKVCYGKSGCKGDFDCAANQKCNLAIGYCQSSQACTSNSDCINTGQVSETCDVHGVCGGKNGQLICSNSACENFQDCPGSIEIYGTYLVGLYSTNPATKDIYCQTFTGNVSNLNVESYLPPQNEKIDKIYMFATQ